MTTPQTEYLGKYLMPDDWKTGERLVKGDDYVDTGYIGSEYRIPSSNFTEYSSPVNIKVTGKPRLKHGCMWVRVKIEWVKDCEPSDFGGGWLKLER